jgi:predicted nucleotidyltransferase
MFAFRSKITKKVLGYYFLNPNQSHYINELADMLALDPGNLYRKLDELETEGILVSKNEGRQKYYSLNKKYPLLKEIKRSFEFKYNLPDILKEKLDLIKGLHEAYIFGSYAKNSLQQQSDIDILLIGDHSTLAAKRLILPLQKEIQREINIIDLTPGEFKARRRSGDDFIKNVFSNKKIRLY